MANRMTTVKTSEKIAAWSRRLGVVAEDFFRNFRLVDQRKVLAMAIHFHNNQPRFIFFPLNKTCR